MKLKFQHQEGIEYDLTEIWRQKYHDDKKRMIKSLIMNSNFFKNYFIEQICMKIFKEFHQLVYALQFKLDRLLLQLDIFELNLKNIKNEFIFLKLLNLLNENILSFLIILDTKQFH